MSAVDCPRPIEAHLIDISERGGLVVGLGARKGERITLAVDTRGLLDAAEIRLEAFFKWAEEGDDRGALAGFEIFSISPKNSVLLKETYPPNNCVKQEF